MSKKRIAKAIEGHTNSINRLTKNPTAGLGVGVSIANKLAI